MITTIIIAAEVFAYGAIKLNCVKNRVKSAVNLSPENTPNKIPIRVIPICTVDRNLFGFSASSSAVFAPELPFFISFSNLNFLDETNAISDIEKIPFNKIKMIIIRISTFIL